MPEGRFSQGVSQTEVFTHTHTQEYLPPVMTKFANVFLLSKAKQNSTFFFICFISNNFTTCIYSFIIFAHIIKESIITSHFFIEIVHNGREERARGKMSVYITRCYHMFIGKVLFQPMQKERRNNYFTR